VTRDKALEHCTAQLAEFNASRAGYERAKAQNATQAEQAATQKTMAEERLRLVRAAVTQPAELSEAEVRVEGAKQQAADSRRQADEADACLNEAQEAETGRRAPLQDAERNLQRLQAEIGALSRLLQPQREVCGRR